MFVLLFAEFIKGSKYGIQFSSVYRQQTRKSFGNNVYLSTNNGHKFAPWSQTLHNHSNTVAVHIPIVVRGLISLKLDTNNNLLTET